MSVDQNERLLVMRCNHMAERHLLGFLRSLLDKDVPCKLNLRWLRSLGRLVKVKLRHELTRLRRQERFLSRFLVWHQVFFVIVDYVT